MAYQQGSDRPLQIIASCGARKGSSAQLRPRATPTLSQVDLYADRTSTATLRANQLRLWFASMAYVLLCALRRIGLQHTRFANATCGTIRLKFLKIGALVRISVRRIKIAMASGCPVAQTWGEAAVLLNAAASARGYRRGVSRTCRHYPRQPHGVAVQRHAGSVCGFLPTYNPTALRRRPQGPPVATRLAKLTLRSS